MTTVMNSDTEFKSGMNTNQPTESAVTDNNKTATEK